jgi:RHS repeat-associated protein
VQSDQVGSPNILTDLGGNVVGLSKNLPFGERFGNWQQSGPWGVKSAIRYAGHEDQPGSAIYMQARMYLPAYGKFAQPDPAYDQKPGEKDSWNLYTYVGNQPVTRTDPTGQYMDMSAFDPSNKGYRNPAIASDFEHSLRDIGDECARNRALEERSATESGRMLDENGHQKKGYLSPEIAVKTRMRGLDLEQVKQREFAGLVFKYADGSWGATEAVPGSLGNSAPLAASTFLPDDAVSIVGTYHTHPDPNISAGEGRVTGSGDHPTDSNSPNFRITHPYSTDHGDIQSTQNYFAQHGMTCGARNRNNKTILFAPNAEQMHWVANPDQIRHGKVVLYDSTGEI